MTRKQLFDSGLCLLIYALLWYLLAGPHGWAFAIPLIVLATVVATWLQLRPWRLSLVHLPGFVGFFLATMFSGAWDVARRALHPRLPLQPAWVSYRLISHRPRVHLLCSAMVGLLPGTLATRIDGTQMHLHVLDERQPWQKTLARLEQGLDRLLIVEEQ